MIPSYKKIIHIVALSDMLRVNFNLLFPSKGVRMSLVRVNHRIVFHYANFSGDPNFKFVAEIVDKEIIERTNYNKDRLGAYYSRCDHTFQGDLLNFGENTECFITSSWDREESQCGDNPPKFFLHVNVSFKEHPEVFSEEQQKELSEIALKIEAWRTGKP